VSREAGPDQSEQRSKSMIRELAIPAPFELSAFGACIERRTRRVAELVPTVMEAGAPSGAWLRTARADYLFYEERTSPFHQAHIVLSLAGRMLLGNASGPQIDRRLVPDVSPELVRLMLGDSDQPSVTRHEAETFAFLALHSARAAGYPPVAARRAQRDLQPLHSALRDVVPETTSAVASGTRSGARIRLYRQVIEVRDAMLAVRPFRDPEAGRIAERDGRAAGLSGDELAAAVEAAVLASALHGRTAGHHAAHVEGDPTWDSPGGRDLLGEVTYLEQVSRALARSRPEREPGVPGLPGTDRVRRWRRRRDGVRGLVKAQWSGLDGDDMSVEGRRLR
jgi:hypothetical protein